MSFLDGARLTSHSGIPAAHNNLEHLDRRPREHIETSYREGPTMATALVSPSAPYHHQHHNSYSSGYPPSAPATNSMPGMISPVEPRRASNESEPSHPHRQSLPSISEVISGTKSSYAPPSAAPVPPAQTLPSPFSAAPPPRPFGDVGVPDRNSSPRALHPPPSSAYQRPEALPAFSDPARPAVTSRPVPPALNTFTGQHQSPPVKIEQLETEQRHPEPQPLSAGHHRPPQPAQPLTGLYSETGRLPPGQLPLSAYPISPSHAGPALPSPYEPQRPAAYGEEGNYQHQRASEYKGVFDKPYEAWGYQEALQLVRLDGARAMRTKEWSG